MFNKALNNMRFIYFSCTIATRDLPRKKRKNCIKTVQIMNKSSFFIVGKHAVIEALKNRNRKVLRVFLTEESKKTIHKLNPKTNLLNLNFLIFLFQLQILDVKYLHFYNICLILF